MNAKEEEAKENWDFERDYESFLEWLYFEDQNLIDLQKESWKKIHNMWEKVATNIRDKEANERINSLPDESQLTSHQENQG